jgi:hypothetical protein
VTDQPLTPVATFSTPGRLAVMEAHLQLLLTTVKNAVANLVGTVEGIHPLAIIQAQIDVFQGHLNDVAANVTTSVDHQIEEKIAAATATNGQSLIDKATSKLDDLTQDIAKGETAITGAVQTGLDTVQHASDTLTNTLGTITSTVAQTTVAAGTALNAGESAVKSAETAAAEGLTTIASTTAAVVETTQAAAASAADVSSAHEALDIVTAGFMQTGAPVATETTTTTQVATESYDDAPHAASEGDAATDDIVSGLPGDAGATVHTTETDVNGNQSIDTDAGAPAEVAEANTAAPGEVATDVKEDDKPAV